MASSRRLPVRSLTLAARPANASLSRSCVAGSYQCRFFSQAPQRCGAKFHNVTPPRPSQPSLKTRMRDHKFTQMPTDLGLLPGTFVRPLWKDMPSIFDKPRQRLWMEWTWLKSVFQNFVGVVYFCKSQTKTPLNFKQRRENARRLQKEMYSAFAKGDDANLKQICCENLYRKLSTQISQRPKDQEVKWSLIKYLRTPSTYLTGVRVLSDRATTIPELPNSDIRQIVLRMTSRQSTTKTTVSRTGVPGKSKSETKEQDCTEYVVIQKVRWQGNSGGWKIWGHTKPTTVEAVYNDPSFAPGLSAMERMEAIKSTLERK